MQNRTFMTLALVSAVLATPARADKNQAQEIYHIFDFKTATSKMEMIKAANAGLKVNVGDAEALTPIVLDAPPATPARFKIVNALENSQLSGLLALASPGELAQFKTATCDGAVWIAKAERKIRGGNTFRFTTCLFPYSGGYQLDLYGLDVHEKGGGISAMLGRAMAEAVVGKPGDWTNKTILDLVRSLRAAAGDDVSYVEGQPAFEGTPWMSDKALLPTKAEKAP